MSVGFGANELPKAKIPHQLHLYVASVLNTRGTYMAWIRRTYAQLK